VSEKKVFEIPANHSILLALAAIKMAATAGHRLTLDPIGKCSNAFFSETTWIIETKLPRNDHWNVLYQVAVFYADRKSKMATTAGHRGGHLGFPIGIKNTHFVEDHAMIIPGQFGFNYPSGFREAF
jgi:hypothetical protein